MISIQSYFTYIVNTVFIVTGAVSTIAGAVLMNYWQKYETFSDQIVWILPMALMIIGLIVLCLGVFGCTGLPMRHKPTAVAFYISANVLIFLEIGIGIYWAIMWSNYPNYLKPLQSAFDNYKADPEPWKFLHESQTCCGINGREDFTANYLSIPRECATRGCQPALLEALKSDAYWLIFVSVICGILKWLMLLAAFVIPFPDSPPSEFKVSGAGSAYYFVDRNNR